MIKGSPFANILIWAKTALLAQRKRDAWGLRHCPLCMGLCSCIQRRHGFSNRTVICFSFILFFAPVVEAQMSLRVEWKDENLSVIAEQAPLSQILQQVTHWTGVEFRTQGGLQRKVSQRFSALSLHEGIKKLLTDMDYIMLEKASQQGRAFPTLVLIFERHGSLSLRVPERKDSEKAELSLSLGDPDPNMRRWSVERVAEKGDKQTFAHLLKALDDDDSEVRQEAIANLGQYGKMAMDPVRNLLSREEAPEVRMAAFQLLGQVGGEEAAAFLQGEITDQDPRVRIKVVEALGYTGSPIATAALVEATKDREPSVRMAALRALTFYVKDDGIKAYLEHALLDENEAVQAQAAELLVTFKD